MPTNTPNMDLPNPTIGVDTGLTWEQSVNSANLIVDGHNHAPGSGVPIIPAGININTALPFNDNNATLLRSARFQPQSAALADPLDLGCLYVTGADLYFNDENGNQIQLTSGGAVNATSSGIADGNSSASFISSVLVVYSDNTTSPPTPGDISCGSILLGLNSASSNRLTVSPPASLVGGSYNLTLPAIPGAASFVTLDTSGNFGASIHTSGGIGTTNLANLAVTAGKIANATITQQQMSILIPQEAVSTGGPYTGTSFVATGMTVSIITTGGAVMLSYGSGTLHFTNSAGGAQNNGGTFQVRRTGTGGPITVTATAYIVGAPNDVTSPPGMLGFIDRSTVGVSGTFTYTVWYANAGSSGSLSVSAVGCFATEL